MFSRFVTAVGGGRNAFYILSAVGRLGIRGVLLIASLIVAGLASIKDKV
jgi:hypothetical protein